MLAEEIQAVIMDSLKGMLHKQLQVGDMGISMHCKMLLQKPNYRISLDLQHIPLDLNLNADFTGELYILSVAGDTTLLSALTTNGQHVYTKTAENATGLVLLNDNVLVITKSTHVQDVPSLALPWGE